MWFDLTGMQVAAYAIIFMSIITGSIMIYAAWLVTKRMNAKQKADCSKCGICKQ
jgi:hypothetical protein